MTIGDISSKTGLSIHTLRYYEKEGLIFPIKRLKNNTRDFTDADLKWIEFIICLKNTGMSLKTIKEYTQSTSKGEEGYNELVQILKNHKESINRDIEKLKSFQKKIDWKINLYSN